MSESLKRGADVAFGSESANAPSTEDIRAQLVKRDTARGVKDWETADGIKSRLRSLGVEVREEKGARGGTWRTQDGRCGIFEPSDHGFHFEASFTSDKIEDMLQRRDEARRAKDWGTADSVKQELRNNGVMVLDREQQWRTPDGRQGLYGDAARAAGERRRLQDLSQSMGGIGEMGRMGGMDMPGAYMGGMDMPGRGMPRSGGPGGDMQGGDISNFRRAPTGAQPIGGQHALDLTGAILEMGGPRGGSRVPASLTVTDHGGSQVRLSLAHPHWCY